MNARQTALHGSPLLLVLLLARTAAGATEPPPLPLVPVPHEKVPFGRVAAAEGAAGGALHRFSLADLQLTQPVLITLLPRVAGGDLELQLFEDDWSSPTRSVRAAGGPSAIRLRTQGELGIGVKAAGPTEVPYQILVWVSDELDELALPPAIAPPDEVRGGGFLGLVALRPPLVIGLVLAALAMLLVLAVLAGVVVATLSNRWRGGSHAG